MCNGPFEVIDHRNQVLEEILGAILGSFLALAQRTLAEILELGLEAQQAILGVGELLAHPRDHRLGLPLRERLRLEDPVARCRSRAPGRGSARICDRFGRFAQRRLELGIDRDRAALVGGRFRLPAFVALATHPESLSVIAREQNATSGITRE